MFLEVPDVLNAEELARVRQLALQARYQDGKVSNPHSAAKNNLQIDPTDAAHAEASRLMAGALMRCGPFRDYAFPRIMAPPLLAKYAPGMTYGVHADSAFMPLGARPLRSDVSCTIFIADPATYEGGELTVHLGTRSVSFKGQPGAAVVYPSHTLHEVKPVTAGERLVAISFIESMIPDPTHRELLYQLNEVSALEGFNISWENRTRLQYVCSNLRRMWGEHE
ncbi:MAG: Fe2+-dependent dioxygenase [Alphaproteobacteria bacterium]|jgi:PKHD-type hydroxylase|nr:Fe2+-dependent dioxygenase [Alphaproteobacteria bacterium]